MNMEQKDIALVIVGTNPHAELIRKLKQRGYYVLLVDFAENPPAKKIADEHHIISVFDADNILKLAKERGVKLVISAAAERANAIACFVSEALGLNVPYSYKTAMEISNKVSMKNRMKEFNIPTSNFVCVNKIEDLKIDDLMFPVVAKPADGYGSKGVCKYDDIITLKKEMQNYDYINKNSVIIEEYLTGREFGLYCFLDHEKAKVIFVNEKIKCQEMYSMPAYGTISNPNLDDSIMIGFEEIANKIMHAFSLKNTPLLIQLVLTNRGIKLLEFTPRLGGGVSFRTVKMQTDFDFLELSINSFLGHPYSQNYCNKNIRIADSGIYVKHGLFKKIVGHEKLISEGIIEEIILYKTKGMEVGKDFSSSSRVGSFIIKANNDEELYHKIKEAYSGLEVYSIDDKPIILKDFHM
jgi:phosphoribosylamine-glycine ligase